MLETRRGTEINENFSPGDNRLVRWSDQEKIALNVIDALVLCLVLCFLDYQVIAGQSSQFY